MEDLSTVSSMIAQLLRARSPELGARLKQRLNLLLSEQGLPPFNERALGYKKFTDFLKATQSANVTVGAAKAGGDVTVSLVVDSTVDSASDLRIASLPEKQERAPLRNDVWQAFVNPDPHRKRFFNRVTHQIRHFSSGEPASGSKVAVMGSPHDYVEILPVSGAMQSSWMSEFLDSIPVGRENRLIFEPMLNSAYSSSLNSIFTAALKERGEDWKRVRKEKISLIIEDWATQHGIDRRVLHKATTYSAVHTAQNPNHSARLRSQVDQLLALIADEDIEKLIMPTLLAAISIRSRL
jgi:hypothetical protein